ncbi:MAG: hypothetical protein K0Q73_3935, partial [Paenibacillus sp.]|nr:hypothetical protein [Paenibacillus sp.]
TRMIPVTDQEYLASALSSLLSESSADDLDYTTSDQQKKKDKPLMALSPIVNFNISIPLTY